TLGNDPLATTDGSKDIVITHNGHNLFPNDSITLSDADSTNGIPDTEINATHIVRATTPNTYTITVASAATSTGSGGGNAVVEATAIITVNATAHGLPDGDRV